jgi:hypothetical protein
VDAEMAHVAERHRLTGWVLWLGHSVVLSMKEKAQRWAGLVKGGKRPEGESKSLKDREHVYALRRYGRVTGVTYCRVMLPRKRAQPAEDCAQFGFSSMFVRP